MPRLHLSLALLLFPLFAFAADPGAAIGQARQAINDRRFDDAIKVLEAAMPDADRLAEPQHTQALAALHFYDALAYSGANKTSEARREIAAFRKFSPQTKSVDAAKYDKRFVTLFAEVVNGGENTFDALYPGWATFGAGKDEKKRRIEFADEMFTTGKTRGSESDRGRVFILLGAPSVVSVKPLTARDGGSNRFGGSASQAPVDSGAQSSVRSVEAADKAMTAQGTEGITKGVVERWMYSRDQLPKNLPDGDTTFKFITQEGYGDHLLQRDFMVNKILGEAAK